MFRCVRPLASGQSLFRQRYLSTHRDMGARDYEAAVAALNTLQTNFSVIDAIRKSGRGMNKNAIPEMVEWCRKLGYEPSDFDTLNPIHIAGTKGKGSTSSFVSSILAQYLPTQKSIHAERMPSSTGLYTSPHLRSVRERIQIDNAPISEAMFANYFWQVWDKLEKSAAEDGHPEPKSVETKPVYFRFLTLMALHCYMKEKVGTAVLECGIGGEYDSTNVLVRPSVCAVTSLGIDHTSMLGETIESIAWHKGGIFKRDVPAFTAPQPVSALDTLAERAVERGTQLQEVQEHSALNGLTLGLKGDFQRINASVAIAVASTHLQKLGFSGIPDPTNPASPLPDEFIAGLRRVKLGGRCEMRQDTTQNGMTWYVDGGHTLESIEMAGRWFANAITDNSPKGADDAFRILVFNQQTRDAASLAKKLHQTLSLATGDPHPFRHAIFCTNTTYKTSGYKADLVSINTNKADVDSLRVQKELAATWDEIDHKATVHVLGTIEEAIAQTRALAAESKVEVLVTGSLHLVGGIIEVLESESENNIGKL